MQSTRESSREPVEMQSSHETSQEPVADPAHGTDTRIRHEPTTERAPPCGRARRCHRGRRASRDVRRETARIEAQVAAEAEARRLARMNRASAESNPVLNPQPNTQQDTTNFNYPVPNPPSNTEQHTDCFSDIEKWKAEVEQYADKTGQAKNTRRELKKRQRQVLNRRAAEARGTDETRGTETESHEPENSEDQNEPESLEHQNEPENREHQSREAEYSSILNHPEHPFWAMPPRVSEAQAFNLSGARTVAEDPSNQALVSTMELAFNNLALYADGYSNYQYCPPQGRETQHTPSIATNPQPQSQSPFAVSHQANPGADHAAFRRDDSYAPRMAPETYQVQRPPRNQEEITRFHGDNLRSQGDNLRSHGGNLRSQGDNIRLAGQIPHATNPQQLQPTTANPQQLQIPTSDARPSWVDPSFPLPSASSPSGEPFFTFTPLSSRYRFRDLERSANLELPTTARPGEADAFLEASRATDERRRQVAREILDSTGWEGLDLKGKKKKK